MKIQKSNAKEFEIIRREVKDTLKGRRLRRSLSLLDNALKNKKFLRDYEWLLFYENGRVIGFALLQYQSGKTLCTITIDKLGALTEAKFGKEALELIIERGLIWKKRLYPDSALVFYTRANRSSLGFWKKVGFKIEQYKDIEQQWVMFYSKKEDNPMILLPSMRIKL